MIKFIARQILRIMDIKLKADRKMFKRLGKDTKSLEEIWFGPSKGDNND